MFLIPFMKSFSKRLRTIDTGVQVLFEEISVAPVAFGPAALFRQRSCQSSFVERHTRDDRDVHLCARREQFIFRILIEDVVDDLDRVDLSAFHSAYAVPWFPAIQTNANRVDEFLTAQVVDAIEPTIVAQPLIIPRVKLNEIETLQIGVAQAAMNIIFDVIQGV